MVCIVFKTNLFILREDTQNGDALEIKRRKKEEPRDEKEPAEEKRKKKERMKLSISFFIHFTLISGVHCPCDVFNEET
jgi:hypothetical protein